MLIECARKIGSPCVGIDKFLRYIEKYVLKTPSEKREWDNAAGAAKDWVMQEISVLVENGKCVSIVENQKEGVFIPLYCREKIEEAYSNIEALADIPFHTGASLRIQIPDGCYKTVVLNTGMGPFFEEKDADAEIPDFGFSGPKDIVVIKFPQNYGTALVTASMMPRKIIEISLQKIRHYLYTLSNKEYAINKLNLRMGEKERLLRSFVDKIMQQPQDCLADMERADDFHYLFWTHFCPMVKNDITSKDNLLPDDLSTLQALFVIEVCSGVYRSMMTKKRSVDSAFKVLEARMEKSPWLYSLDEIVAFKNDKGIPLLHIYSQRELQEYIKNATRKDEGNNLSAWLTIPGELEQKFVKKEKYLSLCVNLLFGARSEIKGMLLNKWTDLLKNYSSEPAMKSDAEFEKMLEKQTKTVNLVLDRILKDPKLNLAYNELAQTPGAIPEHSKIFKNGSLIPFSDLYVLNRRLIISEIRLKLPFRYSIPFIVTLLSLFRRKNKQTAHAQTDNAERYSGTDKHTSEMQKSLQLLKADILPKDKMLDDYLAELEDRWCGLINKNSRENFIADVKALLKDNLRRAMKVYKFKHITRKGLREMSTFIIKTNSALQKTRDKDALHLYMELYMIKLLLGRSL